MDTIDKKRCFFQFLFDRGARQRYNDIADKPLRQQPQSEKGGGLP